MESLRLTLWAIVILICAVLLSCGNVITPFLVFGIGSYFLNAECWEFSRIKKCARREGIDFDALDEDEKLAFEKRIAHRTWSREMRAPD